jgi:hypothetical protein
VSAPGGYFGRALIVDVGDGGAEPLALHVDVVLEHAQVGEEAVALLLELTDLSGDGQALLGCVAVGLLAAVGEDGGGLAAGGGDERVGLVARFAHGGVGRALGEDQRALHLLQRAVVAGRLGLLGAALRGLRLGHLGPSVGLDQLALQPAAGNRQQY